MGRLPSLALKMPVKAQTSSQDANDGQGKAIAWKTAVIIPAFSDTWKMYGGSGLTVSSN